MRGILGAAGRQVAQQAAHQRHRMVVVLSEEMHIAADRGVHRRPAHLVHRHRAAGDRPDHFRPGDEHPRVAAGHDDKVHQRRRIGGPARAGAADHGDLRHHAGEQHVLAEHLAIARQRVHRLLDARAAGIIERHHRHAGAAGELHDADDLVGVRAAERAAGDGEILAEGGHRPAIHVAGAHHHAVGREVLLHAALRPGADIHADFLEGVVLEQVGQPLAGGQLAQRMPYPGLFLAAAGENPGAPFAHLLQKPGGQRHSFHSLLHRAAPRRWCAAACCQACCSSTRVPLRSFGCRNNTGMSCAPIFGSPLPSTRRPAALSWSRAARMSSTSKQRW